MAQFCTHLFMTHSVKLISLTGAMGFVGSVTLEQLLRCCPEVHKIILLVRGKKGQTGDCMPR